MAVMMGNLYSALKQAGADEDSAQKAAEEVANFDNRVTGLEGRIALLDAKVDAKFTLLSWMVGVNMALTLIVVGLVLRLGGLQ
ncbi:MAG TPA: hypothetical protein VF601_18935 [Beijerinckiaceae bacterium]|jgi:hypothetical protein